MKCVIVVLFCNTHLLFDEIILLEASSYFIVARVAFFYEIPGHISAFLL